MPFQELYAQRIYFINKQYRGCKAIVTYNSSIIKKDVTTFVCRRACLPAGSRFYIPLYIPRITERRQRCFHRLTFTIVSFGPLFHHNDQGRSSFPPASRLRRKERYLGVVFSSDSPPSYLFSPSSSRVAQQRSFRFREGRKITPLLLPLLEPVEYIAGVVRLWKSRANLNIYVPGICTYLTMRIFLSRVVYACLST